MRRYLPLVVGLATGLVCAGEARATTYSITTLPAGVYGLGIDDAGQILESDGYQIYDDGQITNIIIYGSEGVYGQAISGNGEVVGLYQPCGFCGENGFSYIGGSVVTIPDIFNGGVNWYFSGINDLGQAVGSAGGGSFSYSNGVFSNLATPSPPDGINDSGEIIGCAYQASYSYVNGVTTPLAVPGGSGTCPAAINNTGTIVGYYSNNGAEQGFIDVGGAFTAFTVPGAYATYVNGINDDGVLLGSYDTSSGTFGFIATPVSNTSSVPEPASLVILGTGAFALSVATRSGRRRQSVDLGHSDDT